MEYRKALKDRKLLLEYYLLQYGKQVPNESCYIQFNGSRVDNYIICHIRSRLSNLYGCCPSDIDRQDVVLANLVELRKMILKRISEGKDMDRKIFCNRQTFVRIILQ